MRSGGAPVARHPAHRARKRFGQHFLERPWVDKVVALIDPRPGDTFIEIGPGTGALTRPLAERARAVAAYEIDRDLAARLRATMPPNVTIVEGDVLAAHPRLPLPGSLRIAANLPYNVASPIMFAIVDWSRRAVPIVDATLMLQREVADRLAAPPGSRDYGVLSILIGHRARVSRLLTLPPGAFRPPPKVQSAVVRLVFHAPDPPVRDEAAFASLVKGLFMRRRKTIANALRAYCSDAATDSRLASDKALALADLDPARRPETLSIAELARLSDILAG